jgi:hypothetical protein
MSDVKSVGIKEPAAAIVKSRARNRLFNVTVFADPSIDEMALALA